MGLGSVPFLKLIILAVTQLTISAYRRDLSVGCAEQQSSYVEVNDEDSIFPGTALCKQCRFGWTLIRHRNKISNILTDFGRCKKNHMSGVCAIGNCEEGTGLFLFDNGDIYTGDFKDSDDIRDGKGGYFHGKGNYTWADRTSYVGEYKDDLKSGHGMHIWSDGSKYTGSWNNDYIEGFGTYTYFNNNTYVGEWEDGVKHGTGRYDIYDAFLKKYLINATLPKRQRS